MLNDEKGGARSLLLWTTLYYYVDKETSRLVESLHLRFAFCVRSLGVVLGLRCTVSDPIRNIEDLASYGILPDLVIRAIRRMPVRAFLLPRQPSL